MELLSKENIKYLWLLKSLYGLFNKVKHMFEEINSGNELARCDIQIISVPTQDTTLHNRNGGHLLGRKRESTSLL
jgi:hypothetical protein